jgi:hypothetical protein
MASKYLGERIDIHTGGVDHIPVRRDVSLQDLFARREAADRGPADTQLTPEQLAFQNMVLGELRRMVDEELTDRQRGAVVAVILEGMPHLGGGEAHGHQPERPLQATARRPQKAQEANGGCGFLATRSAGSV